MLRTKIAAGFALPAIVITGTVVFMVMVVVLSSTSSVRQALDSQFYDALARDAAESGAMHAKACLNDATFTAGTVSINPQTTCAGGIVGGASLYIVNASTDLSMKYRSTYSARVTDTNPNGRIVTLTGTTEQVRKSNGLPWKSYNETMILHNNNIY